ncbi:SAGA-associated factor 73, partial [Rhagoletis pomonella]|uniref:SAGA-associated factor 73 n=1 Tax=Rhagoletis pomonella TaxID=28610 RepID=UPI0017807FBA
LFPEPRLGPQQQRQLRSGAAIASSNHPYIFLARPRTNGDGHEVQGFKVVQIADNDDDDADDNPVNNVNKESNNDDDDIDDAKEDDDDEEEQDNSVDNADDDDDEASFELNDDDADDDENENDINDVASNIVFLRSRVPHSPRLRSQLKNQNPVQSSTFGNRASQFNAQLVLKNAKPTNMMVSREHAGAIMVPDGFIEIEGQSVVDEKTGKTALLVPRAALEAIPDGSVVALVESSADESEEARANRVIVRRRRKGSRRNVRRRQGGNRRRQGGNRRRRRGGNRRQNVRVYQVGGATRRRGSRRGGRPVVLQG